MVANQSYINSVVIIRSENDTLSLALVHPRFETLWWYDEQADEIVANRFVVSNSVATANAVVSAAGLVNVSGSAITTIESVQKGDIIGRIDPL